MIDRGEQMGHKLRNMLKDIDINLKIKVITAMISSAVSCQELNSRRL